MLVPKNKTFLKNQSGMAALEMIPIFIIIALLLNFALGFFGVVHTGILNSIAARNYAFETFNHKTDLRYFAREEAQSKTDIANYMHPNSNYQFRLHGIASDLRPSGQAGWVATARPIAFIGTFGGVDKDGNALNDTRTASNNNKNLHNRIPSSDGIKDLRQNGLRVEEKWEVFPVWIRPQYGICMNNKCGEP